MIIFIVLCFSLSTA